MNKPTIRYGFLIDLRVAHRHSELIWSKRPHSNQFRFGANWIYLNLNCVRNCQIVLRRLMAHRSCGGCQLVRKMILTRDGDQTIAHSLTRWRMSCNSWCVLIPIHDQFNRIRYDSKWFHFQFGPHIVSKRIHSFNLSIDRSVELQWRTILREFVNCDWSLRNQLITQINCPECNQSLEISNISVENEDWSDGHTATKTHPACNLNAAEMDGVRMVIAAYLQFAPFPLQQDARQINFNARIL